MSYRYIWRKTVAQYRYTAVSISRFPVAPHQLLIHCTPEYRYGIYRTDRGASYRNDDIAIQLQVVLAYLPGMGKDRCDTRIALGWQC